MIVVWGRTGCGPCLAVKAAFRAKGVPFVERNLSEAAPADIARWGKLTGTSAPVVEHAGGAFAGFIPAKVQAVIDARR